MNILPAGKIREADSYTIKNEPIAGIDLMERAAMRCFEKISELIPDKSIRFHLFCGPGNNGGDGLVIARLVHQAGYSVQTHIIWFTQKASSDFQTNLQRLQQIDAHPIASYHPGNKIDAKIQEKEIIIDAIFGNGLSRPVNGFAAEAINFINQSGALVLAVDVPSGLFIDKNSTEDGGAIVRADFTFTFSPPKLAFMFPENDRFIGNWTLVDIGLKHEFIDHTKTGLEMVLAADIAKILKKRRQYDHKGSFGHCLIFAGSEGKTGAAVLAAKGALRAGAGLVSVHLPKNSLQILQIAAPEAMASVDTDEKIITEIPELSKYNSIAIGPGIGQNQQTAQTLKILIQNSSVPIIFDADALNILSENKTWLKFIPVHSVLTPHPGEFQRLVGKASNNFERLEMQKEFCIRQRCWMVLKGAHSCICAPDGSLYFNSTGNPGMASGGSGDVLTGIIAGLMAQGYQSGAACILGVYLHGLAGDLALADMSEESLLAGDLTQYLGKAFMHIRQNITD